MRRMFWALFIIFVVPIQNAHATDQSGETFIYNGERLTFGMREAPLESYFNAQQSRPKFQSLTGGRVCTGELKGYHGVWEVKEGYLFLVKLQKPCPRENDPDMLSSAIFHQDPPITATWFSGDIHALFNGDIEKNQAEKVGLKWEIIFEKLTKNGLVKVINADQVRLTVDLYGEKNRISNILGDDFSKVFLILQQSYGKLDLGLKFEKGRLIKETFKDAPPFPHDEWDFSK